MTEDEFNLTLDDLMTIGRCPDILALRQFAAEVKRLQADLATANKVIVSLLGENADLASRLRALGGERPRQ